MTLSSTCRFKPCYFYSTAKFLILKINNLLTKQSQNKILPDLNAGMTVILGFHWRIGFPFPTINSPFSQDYFIAQSRSSDDRVYKKYGSGV